MKYIEYATTQANMIKTALYATCDSYTQMQHLYT